MALTANRDLLFYTSRELIEVPVDDSANIYKGSLVGRKRSTGYARPLVAGDDFLGVSYKQADNTVVGHTAGGISVRLYQAIDIVHALSGVAVGDIGKDVYASDESTLTLTPTGNSRVGRVIGVESANTARVRIQPVTEFEGQFENLPIIALADAAATLTLDHMNRVLLMSNSSGRTLTLPAVATVRAGAWIRIVKTNVTAAAITIDPNAAETVDGAATLATIDAQFDTVLLLCTGSEWIVLSRDIA